MIEAFRLERPGMQGVILRLDRAWRNRLRLDALVGDQDLDVRQRLQDSRGAATIADPALGER